VFGGAIITPAAPATHHLVRQCAHRREARRRDADDDRQRGARRIIRLAICTLSSWPSFGASPSWPSTVMPVEPMLE
jgi:hypothetical protein